MSVSSQSRRVNDPTRVDMVTKKDTLSVTFVCPNDNQSGGTRVVAIYADHLARRGHDVTVVFPRSRPPSLRERTRSLIRERVWIPRFSISKCSFFQDASVRVLRLQHFGPVKDGDLPDADVVIASWWETAEWVAELSATKGAKVYFIQHHEIHDFLPIERSKATYKLPLHKIVIAPWLKRVMKEQYGDSVVDLVPNSVDRRQFFASVRRKQSTPSIGFLYASAPFKGLDITLAAIQIVRERFPELRCISFGSERVYSHLALPEGTEFHRSPPQNEIRNLYARCDTWITASRSEGFNLPALEAMACGTPVVSTRTGWPEEAIKTGWNGVLVSVDDVADLARGVEWVVSRSDEEWTNLSSNAYETASMGSWEESTRAFEVALKHACRRAARGEIQGKCRYIVPLFAT